MSSEDNRRVFLSARWMNLLMLQFEADPGLLERYVPAGTELDDFGGRVYVSMVGFRFLDTRVLGLPIPWHRDFDEVNLRFYVRRRDGDGVRRGVVFIKEIVPRRAIAWVARGVYNENYSTARMRHDIKLPVAGDPSEGLVSYAWKSGSGWNRMSAVIAGAPRVPGEGTHASFIAEHYWGYARQRRGATLGYRVEHPPWRVWEAGSASFDCDVPGVYEDRWKGCLTQRPVSALVAEGSAVIVNRGQPVIIDR